MQCNAMRRPITSVLVNEPTNQNSFPGPNGRRVEDAGAHCLLAEEFCCEGGTEGKDRFVRERKRERMGWSKGVVMLVFL